ncbi:MAG: phage holin, lambda family [Gammaproteobacteria bacterium]|nr:phage holin, lambda family [Gammaproteobacteria bacterium]
MMKMPDKSPDLWAAALAWLSVHAPSVYAFLLSVTIAVVRVIYGGGTRRQMVLEGVMCGLATLTIVPLLQYLGLPQSMATFAGGLVGFIGVEKLRDIAIRFGERKAGV